MSTPEVLVEVRNLQVSYQVHEGRFGQQRRSLRAVDDISFDVYRGETLGLVGESGCGKTTTGRSVLRLEHAHGGSVRFDGTDVFAIPDRDMRKMRAQMQIIFQDPYSSLDPRVPVGTSIVEGLRAQGVHDRTALKQGAADALSSVSLSAATAERYPHELSGGQRQRVVIARALACDPKFIVCDEAVSALDVSVQAQILNLLQDLQAERGLTYLFIAHDLAVVEHASDRVAVMYLGKIVEIGTAAELYGDPRHPYTRALLASIPDTDPRKASTHAPLKGEVPSPVDIPTGCRFRTRCPLAIDRCKSEEPALLTVGGQHQVACHVTGAAHQDPATESTAQVGPDSKPIHDRT